MLVRIDAIEDSGLAFTFCEPADSFPALKDLEGDGVCRFSGPIRVEGRVRLVSGLVEVEGEIRTAVELPCGRCLVNYSTALDIPFAVTYSRETPAVEDGEEGEEVELTAEEMGLIPFSGEEIDLREAVQEQVVMALPLQPLCRSDCQGLCPHCGTDLNRERCDCEAPAFNNRFGALRNLKLDREGDGD